MITNVCTVITDVCAVVADFRTLLKINYTIGVRDLYQVSTGGAVDFSSKNF